MSELATIPTYFEEAAEFDRFRPDFMQHVVAPLLELATVELTENVMPLLLDDLAGYGGDVVRSHSILNGDPPFYNPARHANLTLFVIHNRMMNCLLPGKYPSIWPELTDRQQQTMVRFGPFFDEIDDRTILSVARSAEAAGATVDMIHGRHPELGLNHSENLILFLRDPLTPSLLRGFMPGGNGFADGLRPGLNQSSDTAAWEKDPLKPVLAGSGDSLRVTAEVRSAARAHRINSAAEVAVTGFAGNGLRHISTRHSSGCPMRRLYFRIDEQSLVEQDLSLTQLQVQPWLQGVTPPITQIEKSKYQINHDGVKAMCKLLAAGLEVVNSGAKQP